MRIGEKEWMDEGLRGLQQRQAMELYITTMPIPQMAVPAEGE
jgi:hypothetical protein